MPRRGTLLAYVRRDDADPSRPGLVVPSTWTKSHESSEVFSGVETVWPLGREGSSVISGVDREHADVFFHAWLSAVHATLPRAVFVCVGHPIVLERLAERIAADGLPWTRTWSDLPSFRADVTTLAVQLRAVWRAEGVILPVRLAGFEDDDGEGQ